MVECLINLFCNRLIILLLFKKIIVHEDICLRKAAENIIFVFWKHVRHALALRKMEGVQTHQNYKLENISAKYLILFSPLRFLTHRLYPLYRVRVACVPLLVKI